MTSSRFVFVESNTTGTGRLFVRAAAELGYEPVVICKDAARYPFIAADKVQSVEMDTADIDAVHAVIGRLGATSVAGIWSTSEYFVATTARLAEAFGLPGPSPYAVRTCRHKGWQRDALSSAFASPAYRCVRSMADVTAAVEQIRPPWLMKPATGSGSAGVRLCRTRDEALVHAESLLRRRMNERGVPEPPDVMIEEYVTGPEFSVEVLCGRALGVTAKHLSAEPYFVETGHDFPAPIGTEAAATLTVAAERAVAAVGLHWGPAHVELRLTESGAVVIEINPRLAGGMIPELMRLATGHDVIRDVVRVAAGGALGAPPVAYRTASIRFVVATTAGRVSRIAQPVQSADVQAQWYVATGSEVVIFKDFRDRLGHVIACAADATAAALAAESTLARLAVEIEPVAAVNAVA